MLLIQGPHFENHFYQIILIKTGKFLWKVNWEVLLQQQDSYSIIQTYTTQMDETKIIKQAFLGPVWIPKVGRGLKPVSKMHQISSLCLLASYLLWFWQATPSFQAALQVADLHTSQLGASASQDAGNWGILRPNWGCSLPARSCAVPYCSLVTPLPPLTLKIRHTWCYFGSGGEAGRREPSLLSTRL